MTEQIELIKALGVTPMLLAHHQPLNLSKTHMLNDESSTAAALFPRRDLWLHIAGHLEGAVLESEQWDDL